MTTLDHLDEPSRPRPALITVVAVLGVLYAVMIVIVLPRSGDPWPAVPAVPIAHALATSVITAMTALLLYSHASRSGRRGFLVLAGTMTATAVLLGAFPLVYPQLVSGSGDPTAPPRPLLGGAQSSVVLFAVWHLVFPIGVAASAIVFSLDVRRRRRAAVRSRIVRSVALTVLPAVGVVLVVVFADDHLPVMLRNGVVSTVGSRIWWTVAVVAVLALVAAALVTRGDSVITRWLVAVAVLNTGDALVTLGAERYSVGWYFSRVFGLLSLSVLLVMLAWELARVDRRIDLVARRDVLTGVRSRSTFDADMRAEIARADAEHTTLALLWIDLDRFKAVNDRLGHGAGDELLVEVSRRLERRVRDSDLLVRMGGDEFVLVLPGLRGPAPAIAVAERITADLREPVHVAGVWTTPAASVGVTFYPDPAHGLDEIVRQADVAMYEAKSAGGDRFVVYHPDLDVGFNSSAMLRERLDAALVNGELDLDAQPILDPVTGEKRSVELLLRWRHDGMRTSAAVFLGEAERSGRIVDIGHQVLDRVEAALPRLLERHPGLDFVAVNISVPEVLDPVVCSRLQSSPLRDFAHRIVLEVTETAVIDSSTRALENLSALRELGYRLAIDDFGVGFSNIVRLEQLHPAIIKIDRSLVSRAGVGEQGAAQVLAWATGISRALGCRTVVEGVETQAELDMVRAVGADLVQGYFFDRPSPLETWLDPLRAA